MKLFNISKRALSVFGLASILFVGSGCEDLLEVNPRQSIDANIALQTRGGVEAAINSVYARLRAGSNYGRGLIAVPDALADLGYATDNSGRLINEARNQFGSHMNNWQNNYYAINEANLILEAIPRLDVTPAVSAEEAAAWEGELKFLRALFYFDLVKVYSYIPGAVVAANDRGGVPVVLEGSVTSEVALTRLPGRGTIDQTYDQIYADLEDAIALLDDGTDKFYAQKGGAHALLSRVALYRKDYARAIAEATNALNSSVGNVLSGQAYVDAWRAADHGESMFEVRYFNQAEGVGGVNESLQSSFTTILDLNNPQIQGGWGDFVPTDNLLAELGLTVSGSGSDPRTYIVTRGPDVRNQIYDVGNGRGSNPKLESTKFLGKSGFPYVDNVPVIRKSEMLLNRAEARTYPGASQDLAGALTDLNDFRAARGLTPYVGATDEASLREEILFQRKLEFAFEGHRFFDLKRLGRNILKQQGDVQFTDIRILPAIPAREVDGNPNVQQNEGY